MLPIKLSSIFHKKDERLLYPVLALFVCLSVISREVVRGVFEPKI